MEASRSSLLPSKNADSVLLGISGVTMTNLCITFYSGNHHTESDTMGDLGRPTQMLFIKTRAWTEMLYRGLCWTVIGGEMWLTTRSKTLDRHKQVSALGTLQVDIFRFIKGSEYANMVLWREHRFLHLVNRKYREKIYFLGKYYPFSDFRLSHENSNIS